jgi:methylenetetrahydrofolate dehydrogenase (NADP+) / methenyltetrahydrofolate cyclohydrolase
MTATIINGNQVAHQVRAELKVRVDALKAKGVIPGLAVLLVGDNAASEVYVKHKVKACGEVGLHSEMHRFPADASQANVLAQIKTLNADPAIHGILVQLPLPPQIESSTIVDAISYDKDVDGFHFYNLGGLIAGYTVFPPCTPYGVMRLLDYMKIPIEGRNAVIVGRSNIVGKPMALMLLQRGASVSVCHSKTRDLVMYTRLADILVVATGRPNLVTAGMVKDGAVVIDVGMNRLPDGRLAGDVDFERVKEKASYITPVPGGVGPMTVTMLIANTILSAERFNTRAGEATAARAY